jgi:hypothetical protein
MNKIKAIQGSGTLDLHGKTFYKFEVTLDDDSTGEVLALKADRWKVGDEVEVNRVTNNYGTKFKLSVPEANRTTSNFQRGNGGRSFNPEVQFRVDASWAIGQAVTLLGSKLELTAVPDHVELVKTALHLLDARSAVIAAMKQTTKTEEEQAAEDSGHMPNKF